MTKLEEIRAAAEAATEGPWTTEKHGKKHGAFSDQCIVAAVARGQGIYTPALKGTFPANDQKFIALARTAVPALCDALEFAMGTIEAIAEVNEEKGIFPEVTKMLKETPALVDKILDSSSVKT